MYRILCCCFLWSQESYFSTLRAQTAIPSAPPHADASSVFQRQNNFEPSKRFREGGREALKLVTGWGRQNKLSWLVPRGKKKKEAWWPSASPSGAVVPQYPQETVQLRCWSPSIRSTFRRKQNVSWFSMAKTTARGVRILIGFSMYVCSYFLSQVEQVSVPYCGFRSK